MNAPSDREMFRTMGKECIAFRVRRASRVITRLYDSVLAESGLTATQLTLLSAVANRPDLKMSELADVLGFEPSSLSRAMALLLKRKWVRAVPASDKREKLFEITDKGREVARDAWSRWNAAQERLRKALPPGELDAMIRAADSLGTIGPP